MGAVLSATSSVYGQPVTAMATVGTTSGTPAGTVQFSVDGNDVGTPVAVAADHSAASATLTDSNGATLTPGAHQVAAMFVPADATTYTGSRSTPRALSVARAATTTQLGVHPTTVTATVAPVAPGAGLPTGNVRFLVDGAAVGTAPLVHGTATLTHVTPTSQTQGIGAVYAGDTDFTMSTADTTARADPVIAAHQYSAHPRSRYGWYRSAVRITFSCTTHGAALTKPCPGPGNPEPQRWGADGFAQHRGQRRWRGVRHRADQPRPQHPDGDLSGVHNGATYAATSPQARCAATDSLSGITSCRLTRHTTPTAGGYRVTYTATATDQAGNTRSTHAGVRIANYAISNAVYSSGAYTVRRGHSYTLLAIVGSRPRYVDATPYPGRPAGLDHYFHRAGSVNGHARWLLTVTVTESQRHYRYWNIGIKAGHTVHPIRIRVVG